MSRHLKDRCRRCDIARTKLCELFCYCGKTEMLWERDWSLFGRSGSEIRTSEECSSVLKIPEQYHVVCLKVKNV